MNQNITKAMLLGITVLVVINLETVSYLASAT